MLNTRIGQRKQHMMESMMPMLYHFNCDTKAITTTIRWHLGRSFFELLHGETQQLRIASLQGDTQGEDEAYTNSRSDAKESGEHC